jgi:hypothetical protein
MPKPDFPVSVMYKANQTTPVSYSGAGAGLVNVSEDSTITFTKAQGSDPFTFAGITITPTSADFSVVSGAGTTTLVIEDNNADAGTYNYCLNLTLPGGTIIQSDPQIINKG